MTMTETPVIPEAPAKPHPAEAAADDLLTLAKALAPPPADATAPEAWQADRENFVKDSRALVAECEDIRSAVVDLIARSEDGFAGDEIVRLPEELGKLRDRRVNAAQWGRDLAGDLAELHSERAEHSGAKATEAKAAYDATVAAVVEDLRRIGSGEESTETHCKGRSRFPWRSVEAARMATTNGKPWGRQNVEFGQLVRRNCRTPRGAGRARPCRAYRLGSQGRGQGGPRDRSEVPRLLGPDCEAIASGVTIPPPGGAAGEGMRWPNRPAPLSNLEQTL